MAIFSVETDFKKAEFKIKKGVLLLAKTKNNMAIFSVETGGMLDWLKKVILCSISVKKSIFLLIKCDLYYIFSSL
jgi:hypothetical protein